MCFYTYWNIVVGVIIVAIMNYECTNQFKATTITMIGGAMKGA